MDLALNNLQRLICHKTEITKQSISRYTLNIKKLVKLTGDLVRFKNFSQEYFEFAFLKKACGV